MIKNLEVKMYSDGRIDIEFLMIRTSYNIRICVYKDFYRLTGIKHSSKTSYFSANNKIIQLEIFDEIVKCLITHIPKIGETNLVDVIALAISKTNIPEGDWTLSRYMDKLCSQKVLSGIEKYIKTGITKCGDNQDNHGLSVMLIKKQKLSTILTDIKTIEMLLNKVKESARRLQAEIEEEE